MSNNETLIRFRTGAFYVGSAICPIIIKYRPFIFDEDITRLLMKLLTQKEMTIDVYINDLEYPEFNEGKIEGIRRKMARIGGLEMARTSNKYVKD